MSERYIFILVRKVQLLILIVSAGISLNLIAQEDMPGSADYPDVPRIEGAEIRGYSYSDYDEGLFVTGFENKEFDLIAIAGKRTRILYLAPQSFNSVMVWKNYEQALQSLGEAEEVYACSEKTCGRHIGKDFIWFSSDYVLEKHRLTAG